MDDKSRNAVKIRDDSSSRDNSIINNSIIMDVISSRTARIDSRELEKPATFSRDTSNSSRHNRNITAVNSRRETSNSKDARNIRD